MRIISGIFKGLKIATPPGKSKYIRPTSDRSREALFSILAYKVTQSRVLDLFAGTGALGLEALSRGAESAVFIDNGSVALKLIKTNAGLIKNISIGKRDLPAIRVIRGDLTGGLRLLLKSLELQEIFFDMIFLDPPYDKGISLHTLKSLDDSNILADDGIIVAEDRSNADLSFKFQNLELVDQRKYGDTGFWFFKKL